MEANKILNEKEENMGKTKQREGTLVENLERTLSKHRELLTVNSKLAALKDPNNTTRDKKSRVKNLLVWTGAGCINYLSRSIIEVVRYEEWSR